ncbi:hypothetical protein EJA72_25285 [Pseudomonas sp. PB120]|uniref:hypothetical protein n=1 Tax=Pseudomonas sp. PB120 TaxID=2494700 RepID=UPI0012FE0161|nr:hypothetical protein [Pseudomonas sp. PB120]MVV51531.1 hypothetical protein [Pseudomonas sp. PB120]
MHALLKALLTLAATLSINISAHALNNDNTLNDDPLNQIRLFAIFHDDVPESKRSSTYADHIHPFVVEFERITGRKIYVVFDRNRPPYTNFNYKSDDHNKMFEEWEKLTTAYKKERHENSEFFVSRNDRILLITNDFINGSPLLGGMGGLATQPGYSAIAALEGRQAIGHELGHTFNASHDDSEVIYNGWWCETFMFPTAFLLRSNCYVFSEKNKKRIKAYVDSLY